MDLSEGVLDVPVNLLSKKKGRNKCPVCKSANFRGVKYSHYDQFQAANRTLLAVELGGETVRTADTGRLRWDTWEK